MSGSNELQDVEYPAASLVSELCFRRFESLPKTGKPKEDEWTVVAAVVMHDAAKGLSKVVSLGCGTKCVGQSKLCPKGFILNDSHAEVLARRGMLRYLYHELKGAICSDGSVDKRTIFKWRPDTASFELENGISFHFLSTQAPCGDACIVDESDSVPELEPLAKKSRIALHEQNAENVGAALATTVYTGAKLLGSGHRDALQQMVGAVRTKPGRGERTLSMSCSDKLARWQVLGVQGALLAALLSKPIYFKTLNFCSDVNEAAVERAIWRRWQKRTFVNCKYIPEIPIIRIYDSQTAFTYAQSSSKQPSPNGLVWCDIPERLKPYEISVNGKRQGVTTKRQHSPQAALRISKFHFLKSFVEILLLKRDFLKKFDLDDNDLLSLKYGAAKQLSREYQEAWSLVKSTYFQQWTEKPVDLLRFSIAGVESTTEHSPKETVLKL